MQAFLRPRVCEIATSVGVVLCATSKAAAHEKWFHDASPHPTQWAEVVRAPGIFGVVAALLVTAALWLWWRARGQKDVVPGPQILGATPEGRRRFYGLVPLILGVHLGVPLIILGIRGQLFSPNNVLSGPWLYGVGVAQIGIGLCFLYGGFARLGGVLLGVLWLLGIGLFSFEAMLENAHYLGFAAFFLCAGRGPFAVDRLLFPAMEPSPKLVQRAIPLLRIGMGSGLVAVAFTEKLANPALAASFLQQHRLNFTPWIGIPMSDEVFVVCAGATELTIGLALMFGLFPRLVILSAWLFVNMTLTLFSWVELVGHLPLYGVMGILLIWTPGREDQDLWARGVLGEGRR